MVMNSANKLDRGGISDSVNRGAILCILTMVGGTGLEPVTSCV